MEFTTKKYQKTADSTKEKKISRPAGYSADSTSKIPLEAGGVLGRLNISKIPLEAGGVPDPLEASGVPDHVPRIDSQYRLIPNTTQEFTTAAGEGGQSPIKRGLSSALM
jgi:hypothetical protein